MTADMSHLTLRFRNAAGEVLQEGAYTLHHFIPFVRHVMRTLEDEPEIAADPIAYRALLRPCHDAPPELAPEDRSWQKRPALRTSEIAEATIDAQGPVSYAEEVEAYYARGSSALCAKCPERLRCPGSGQPHSGLEGWIELDPEWVATSEPVSYFALRIESAAGRVLHRSTIPLTKLETFLVHAYRTLRQDRRLAATSGGVRIEVIARKDGQREDPVRPSRPEREPAPAGPGKSLVDWDRIEASEPAAGPARRVASAAPAAPDPDLEIRIYPTQNEPLPQRPPRPGEPLPGATADSGHLPIYLHRAAFRKLHAQIHEVDREAGGILVGEAVIDPERGTPYVEIAGVLSAADEKGGLVKMQMNSGFLRLIQERIDRDYPGCRTIGWYQFHMPYVAVQAKGDNVITAGLVGNPSEMFEDEVFMHRNFFPQRWHVGLVIDAVRGSLRFYHLNDGKMDVSTNCQLFG
jgi:hypothetical protein